MSERYKIKCGPIEFNIELDSRAAAAWLVEQGIPIPPPPTHGNTLLTDAVTQDGCAVLIISQWGFKPKPGETGELNGLTLYTADTPHPDAAKFMRSFAERLMFPDPSKQ